MICIVDRPQGELDNDACMAIQRKAKHKNKTKQVIYYRWTLVEFMGWIALSWHYETY